VTFYVHAGYGRAADLWALGVMIFEMVVTFTPFQADNPLQVSWQAYSSYAQENSARHDIRVTIPGTLWYIRAWSNLSILPNRCTRRLRRLRMSCPGSSHPIWSRPFET
jgi:serine/threonine protein kinase